MEQFLTWDILKDYVTFVGIVFSIVAFTKNAWLINKIPTRLWSFIVSFLLLLLVNLHESTFSYFDIVIYGINAILISSSANGIADANKGSVAKWKTNLGLVEYCKAQLGKPYWYGTFGQIATENLLRQKSAQYPTQYKWTDFIEQYGQRVHDCVGLIKGYLWSENLNSTPIYNSKQDKDVNGMKANCTETGNIKTIPELPGVLVFMPGHVGVYIGNGEVIEARGHLYGVVKTKLKDRPWTDWGKLRWLEYQKALVLFEAGQGKEAIEYLTKQGRITNKEQALQKLDLIKNEEWTYIKWANDVKKLEKLESEKG